MTVSARTSRTEELPSQALSAAARQAERKPRSCLAWKVPQPGKVKWACVIYVFLFSRDGLKHSPIIKEKKRLSKNSTEAIINQDLMCSKKIVRTPQRTLWDIWGQEKF